MTKGKRNKEKNKVEMPATAKTKQAPKRNTRGVAQKIRKSAKKTSAPVVLQRQLGGGTSRKRPAR